MLIQCWSNVSTNVYDAGPTLNQHWSAYRVCWLVILCLEGSVIWLSSAYMCTKVAWNPIHFIFADSPSCSPRNKSGRLRADQTRPRRVRIAYSRYPRRSSSCCPPALPGACNRLSNMPRITIGLFGPFSAGTVFRRQNLTFIDVRFWRLRQSDV